MEEDSLSHKANALTAFFSSSSAHHCLTKLKDWIERQMYTL